MKLHAVFRMLFVLTLLAPSVATAQNGADVERFNQALRDAEQQYLLLPNPELSVGERAWLDYGALVNFNFYAIDDAGQETHILRQTDLQFFAHLNVDGMHEFFGQLRYNYFDFNTGDDFDGLGDHYRYPLGDLYWYKFDLGRAIEASQGQRSSIDGSLTVGRQFVHWAGGLVFSDVLYAARGNIDFGRLSFEGFGGRTPSSSFIDFDSSREAFDQDTERDFFGGMVSYRFDRHRPYFFAVHQSDENDQDINTATTEFPAPFPFPPLTITRTTRYDYSSTYFGVGSQGNFTNALGYEAEFVYQIGDGLSNSVAPGTTFSPVAQTREDIEAWAAKLELNYYLKDDNRSQIDFETIIASGDDDRDTDTSDTLGGNLSGTDDTAFNAFGYARTGSSFAAPISNLLSFRVGASAYPMIGGSTVRNLRVGVDFIVFNKFDSGAPLDEPTNDATYLGFETDLFASWRITSDISLNARYGVFFPGEGIATDKDARHFFFTGVSYAF